MSAEPRRDILDVVTPNTRPVDGPGFVVAGAAGQSIVCPTHWGFMIWVQDTWGLGEKIVFF